MDIDQARTFLAIAAHGSFLEAAKLLYVTQSTVSARVQTLETELKARLFVRNRSGATLTPGLAASAWLAVEGAGGTAGDGPLLLLVRVT